MPQQLSRSQEVEMGVHATQNRRDRSRQGFFANSNSSTGSSNGQFRDSGNNHGLIGPVQQLEVFFHQSQITNQRFAVT